MQTSRVQPHMQNCRSTLAILKSRYLSNGLTELLHLWQATDWYKYDVVPAVRILIFAVLKQWLLRQRETEASFVYN